MNFPPFECRSIAHSRPVTRLRRICAYDPAPTYSQHKRRDLLAIHATISISDLDQTGPKGRQAMHSRFFAKSKTVQGTALPLMYPHAIKIECAEASIVDPLSWPCFRPQVLRAGRSARLARWHTTVSRPSISCCPETRRSISLVYVRDGFRRWISSGRRHGLRSREGFPRRWVRGGPFTLWILPRHAFATRLTPAEGAIGVGWRAQKFLTRPVSP